MNIEYKDWLMKPSTEGGGYDLFKIVTAVKKDTEEEYKREKNIGWSMHLESCIKRIINEELKLKLETVTLKEFIEEYKKEKQQILEILN